MRYISVFALIIFAGCIFDSTAPTTTTVDTTLLGKWKGNIYMSGWITSASLGAKPSNGRHWLEFEIHSINDSAFGSITDLTDSLPSDQRLPNVAFHGRFDDTTVHGSFKGTIEYGIGSDKPTLYFGYANHAGVAILDTEHLSAICDKISGQNYLFGDVIRE
ncbi:MAG: hypothetical protein JSS75_07470 [Bacteroidetes bacterium]|nr:hypothetical protein [Bacteroidota bacterium]